MPRESAALRCRPTRLAPTEEHRIEPPGRPLRTPELRAGGRDVTTDSDRDEL